MQYMKIFISTIPSFLTKTYILCCVYNVFYLLSHPYYLQYSVQCSGLPSHTFVQAFLPLHMIAYWVDIICRYLFGIKISLPDFQPKSIGKCIELLRRRNDCSRVRQN